MKPQQTYTVEEVLKIALTLKPEDRKIVLEGVQKSLVDERDVLDKISPFHEKYEATYKALA